MHFYLRRSNRISMQVLSWSFDGDQSGMVDFLIFHIALELFLLRLVVSHYLQWFTYIMQCTRKIRVVCPLIEKIVFKL
jgi:hypothetical protein